jgi:hypothetical protein
LLKNRSLPTAGINNHEVKKIIRILSTKSELFRLAERQTAAREHGRIAFVDRRLSWSNPPVDGRTTARVQRFLSLFQIKSLSKG